MNQTHRKFPTSLLPFCSCAQSFQSSLALCSPMDRSPPGSSVHEIFPARILKCTAKLSSRISSQPRGWTCVSCISYIAGGFFTAEPPGNPPHTLSCCQTAEKLLLCWEVTKQIKNNGNTLKVTSRVTHSYRAAWANSSDILPNQSFQRSIMNVQNTLPVHQGNGHMTSRLTQP